MIGLGLLLALHAGGGCFWDGSRVNCADAGAYVKTPKLVAPTTLSTSPGFACAIDEGRVKCWGKRLMPGPPPLSGITAVASIDEAYYFLAGGTLHGFRPNGTVLPTTPAEKVAAAYGRICVLHDGKILCPGGEIPSDLPAVADFTMVTRPYLYDRQPLVCAVTEERARCFAPFGDDRAVALPTDEEPLKKIFSSPSVVCGIFGEGAVKCAREAEVESVAIADAEDGEIHGNLGCVTRANGRASCWVNGQVPVDVHPEWHHPRIVDYPTIPCVRWDEGARCYIDDKKELRELERAAGFLGFLEMKDTRCHVFDGPRLECSGDRFTFDPTLYKKPRGLYLDGKGGLFVLDDETPRSFSSGDYHDDKAIPGARLIGMRNEGATLVFDGAAVTTITGMGVYHHPLPAKFLQKLEAPTAIRYRGGYDDWCFIDTRAERCWGDTYHEYTLPLPETKPADNFFPKYVGRLFTPGDLADVLHLAKREVYAYDVDYLDAWEKIVDDFGPALGAYALAPYFDRLPYPKFAGLGGALDAKPVAVPPAAAARAWLASISDARWLTHAQIVEWAPLERALRTGKYLEVLPRLRAFAPSLAGNFLLGPRMAVNERLGGG